jgi:hypothetical protein
MSTLYCGGMPPDIFEEKPETDEFIKVKSS